MVISEKPNITPVYPFKDRWPDAWQTCRESSKRAGLGLPKYYQWRSRSGCYFCFYQQVAEWQGLKERHPDLFEKAKSIREQEQRSAIHVGRRAKPRRRGTDAAPRAEARAQTHAGCADVPPLKATGKMHRNPLVEFLRSYGPNAASDALYDEHVQAEARKHRVDEITISAPLVDEIGSLLTDKDPTNIVLTGTAGDGKTYHIRQVAVKYLGASPEEWPGDDLVLKFPSRRGASCGSSET